jgi:hypothetical protein
MVRRGRPLLRAAMVGGVAYRVGKKAHQDAAPAPAPGGLSDTSIAQLEELAQLKEAGALTQEEFDAQRAQLLAS